MHIHTFNSPVGPLTLFATRGALAQKAGHPGASRAVGSACARNPLPLFIPCHRVLRGNGGIWHYSGGEGAETKRRLLILEGALALSPLSPLYKTTQKQAGYHGYTHPHDRNRRAGGSGPDRG